MPRASLPSECVLRTMNVLVTKHTEDDVLNHIMSLKSRFYEIYNPLVSFLEDETQYIWHNNPYLSLNWQKHYEYKAINRPSPFKQRYETSGSIYPNLEEHIEKLEVLSGIRRDITTCERVFKWSESNPEFAELEYEIDRDMKMLHHSEEELVWVDTMRFRESKQKWEKENVAWLEEFERKQDHKKHRTREQYEAKMKESLANRDAYQWYGGEEGYRRDRPFVDTSESCEYCKQDAIRRREYEEREALRLEEEQEEQVEEEKKEEQQVVQIPVFEPKTCECCQFTANTQREWSFHIGSKDHSTKEKLKKLYCSTCEIQCKNDADYQVHIQTQKHKKKCGELPQIFKCEACNYETNIKRNYELHCGTKKHKETAKKV